mmetsp:Transcript_29163/g.78256  ORF Transcript_29163/g.78256 Transcript_29163/m.78256 type:complete len:94 (-) Transcript_29163:789-1070(-)
MTSQIPSVAIIMKLSLASTVCSVNSGSAETPIVCWKEREEKEARKQVKETRKEVRVGRDGTEWEEVVWGGRAVVRAGGESEAQGAGERERGVS